MIDWLFDLDIKKSNGPLTPAENAEYERYSREDNSLHYGSESFNRNVAGAINNSTVPVDSVELKTTRRKRRNYESKQAFQHYREYTLSIESDAN